MTKRNNNYSVEFSSYEQAAQMTQKAEHKRNRVLIGLAIAALTTGLTLFGLFGSGQEHLLALAIMTAIPAYILGGGFGSALRAAGKLAKFGWLIVPFPYDLLTGLITLLVAGFLFFCVPVFFVLKNFINVNAEYNEMKSHMSFYTVAEQV